MVRRSIDGGQTWLPAQVISRRRHGDFYIQMASHGADALVVFATWHGILSRISHDRGVTWQKGPVIASESLLLDMALDYVGGRWRLMYTDGAELHYTQSRDGLNWSANVLVDSTVGWVDVLDIGLLDGHIVAPALAGDAYWARRN